MKHLLLVLFGFFVISDFSVVGQVLSPGGVIRVPPGQILSPRQQRKIEDVNRRTQNREELQKEIMSADATIDRKTKIPLFLKDKLKISDIEEKELAILANDKKAKFLRLWNNTCGGEKVFDANNEDCLAKAEYSIVSVYSFYLKDYKPHFADFSLIDNKFVINQQGQFQMLIEVGNTSLADLTKEAKQVKTLQSLELAKVNFQKAKTVFESGFQFYDIEIVNSAKIAENQTCLLRSFFEDKRRTSGFTIVDKMVAFRVIKQGDEFVTIAWKEVVSNE